MTTQKYEYKIDSKTILEAAHFPKLDLLDSHEYATRLANLDSTHVLIINENRKPCKAEVYLKSADSYRNDSSAVTLSNGLCLRERNGHQVMTRGEFNGRNLKELAKKFETKLVV